MNRLAADVSARRPRPARQQPAGQWRRETLMSLLFLYSQRCGALPVVSIRRTRGAAGHSGTDDFLPNSHGESVDVFVQLIQQRDGLDDHVVHPVHVELDLRPRVAVAETQLGLGRGQRGQTFDQRVEVKTDAWKEGERERRRFVGLGRAGEGTGDEQRPFRFSV